MHVYFPMTIVVVFLISATTDLFGSGKHPKKERREERRTERDHRCDDDIAIWEGPRNPEELWFDNDGEFESSRKGDHCRHKDRDCHKRHKHQKHHKEHRK